MWCWLKAALVELLQLGLPSKRAAPPAMGLACATAPHPPYRPPQVHVEHLREPPRHAEPHLHLLEGGGGRVAWGAREGGGACSGGLHALRVPARPLKGLQPPRPQAFTPSRALSPSACLPASPLPSSAPLRPCPPPRVSSSARDEPGVARDQAVFGDDVHPGGGGALYLLFWAWACLPPACLLAACRRQRCVCRCAAARRTCNHNTVQPPQRWAHPGCCSLPSCRVPPCRCAAWCPRCVDAVLGRPASLQPAGDSRPAAAAGQQTRPPAAATLHSICLAPAAPACRPPAAHFCQPTCAAAH